MSSSIVKLLAVALEEAKKLEKQETERNSDSGGNRIFNIFNFHNNPQNHLYI